LTDHRCSIKKAAPLDSSKPVFAVKFIHKEYAIRHGCLTNKQLQVEISLHKYLDHHPNIVQFFDAGEDPTWRWIAMELADGGDLFDKIESDVGVGEDIAHLYFTQLISAVAYMHSKGVGHRDIKPENILLSAEGNLKIADFGLATLFEYKGAKKVCTASCGSPPYTAPEVVTVDHQAKKKLDQGYQGNLVDIWSCAVVLFVLLVGNTPWDEPMDRSYEFYQYKNTDGRPDDELWHKLPDETLSLLRGMMQIDPQRRLSLEQIRGHPWVMRHNPYISSNGGLENPVHLATTMFESMKVDFSQDPMASPRSQRSTDSMDIDEYDMDTRVSSTPVEKPTNDIIFDWERPSRGTQSSTTDSVMNNGNMDDQLAEEPSLSQFSAVPQVPLTRTQFARRFRDIIPSHSLTRFFSFWPLENLHTALLEALQKLVTSTASSSQSTQSTQQASTFAHSDKLTSIKVRMVDNRNCLMSGHVAIEKMSGVEAQVLEVSFVKATGDPVEWRRLFKKVVVLCRDAVFRPDDNLAILSQQ